MMKKKYLLGIIVMMLLIASLVFAKEITLTVNGTTIPSTVAPIQENGTTLVPLRVISENLGATVDYNEGKKLVTITKGAATMQLVLAKNAGPGEVKVINGTTMVPIRFISEKLGATASWDSKSQTVAISTPSLKYPVATIKVKGLGTIEAELYPQYAPNTVANFISLANNQFYDGLTLHRVVKDFVLQGGCPNGDGTGGPGYSIPGEFVLNGFDANRLAHVKGVLSMARSNDPDSAGSQFFIMSGDADYLNGNYAAFGKVTKGIELVDKINKVSVDSNDKPLEPLVIESIRVETFGVYYPEPNILK